MFCLTAPIYSFPAISCGELPDPDNGQVDMDNDIFDSSATYSCILGYEILGVAIRTCLANMSWSDEQPTCERERDNF